MTSESTTRRAHQKAERAADSKAVDRAARAGFVARGIIYLLIGIIAIRLAFHPGDGKQADRSGALAEIAEKPFGLFLLWALGIATAGMALWRLSEAAFGASGEDGDKAGKRLISFGRAVFYGFVAYSVLSFAMGSGGGGSSDKKSKDITATALGWPGGRWIVAIAGAVVVGVGIGLVVRGVMRKFRKHLKTAEMGPRTERVVDVLGIAGNVSRGILFGTAGVFAIVAAVQFEPKKAKGMDDTLRSFTDTPAGPWLLVVIAIGLLCFGAFSFASARYRRT
ncbi:MULTISPECIES: DUF1206 domain-containing protein [unclassified Streptomyces]|uniref:DUF1206 domain-containing protein n=1 Tax=unclassified Streptomyces TaxID=2593676 RepID=UPI001F511905|nr:DUF1206 domain-containing protein [Streptomyces sp. GZWMJZ-114]